MILRIREIGDASDDAALWPVPAVEPGGWLIEPEADDGGNPVFLPLTGVHEQEVVPGGAKTLTRVTKASGWVHITDSRCAVAVQNFDKGSTYVGFGVGAVVGLAATGISKARAAQRRKGKLLVGHVRWQWLSAVAACPASRGQAAQLRLVCNTKQGDETRCYRLDVDLAGAANSMAAAQDCIRRAAAWRLARFPGREEHWDRIRELAGAPPLAEPARGKVSTYSMPNYFFMNRATAYPEAGPSRRASGAGR